MIKVYIYNCITRKYAEDMDGWDVTEWTKKSDERYLVEMDENEFYNLQDHYMFHFWIKVVGNRES